MNSPQIISRINAIVMEVSPHPAKEIEPTDDLFENGTLDSVALIGLVTRIEDEFQIKVSPTEYSPENFMTIQGLGEMVGKLLIEQGHEA